MSKVVTKFNSKYYDDVLSLGGTLIRHGFSLEVTPDDEYCTNYYEVTIRTNEDFKVLEVEDVGDAFDSNHDAHKLANEFSMVLNLPDYNPEDGTTHWKNVVLINVSENSELQEIIDSINSSDKQNGDDVLDDLYYVVNECVTVAKELEESHNEYFTLPSIDADIPFKFINRVFSEAEDSIERDIAYIGEDSIPTLSIHRGNDWYTIFYPDDLLFTSKEHRADFIKRVA